MDKITIADLEGYWHVGVTEDERRQPQRLLITLEMDVDMTPAAASDDLARTIDYAAVTRRVLAFSDGRQWELIETLASDLAAMVLNEFAPAAATVEVKKFILPQTRYVSVRLTRGR